MKAIKSINVYSTNVETEHSGSMITKSTINISFGLALPFKSVEETNDEANRIIKIVIATLEKECKYNDYM